MPAVIALVLTAIVALAVLSFTVHVLFSPGLLVAIAIVGLDQVPAAPLPPVTPQRPAAPDRLWTLSRP